MILPTHQVEQQTHQHHLLPLQAAVQDLEAVDFSVVTMARKLRAVLTTEVQQKAPEGKAMAMATDKELRSMDLPITSW